MHAIRERMKQGIEWNVRRGVPIVLGLTSLFSSLLIYSAVMMGFRRFQYVTEIMGVFAPVLLLGALAASAVLFVLALKRRVCSSKVLCGVGGLLSIVGAAIFCMFITGYAAPEFMVGICAVSAGAGEVMVCCVWGRIGKRLSFEKALVVNVVAFALALGIELLISSVAGALALGLFLGCTIVAAALPLFMPASETSADDATAEKKPAHILKALQELALEPAIGVLVFAFCLGSMRALFWEAHNEYVVGSLGAVVIAVLVLVLPRKQSLARLFSVVIIPSCAVALLALNNIVLRIGQGDFWAQSLLYLFFGLAIILTLATLCATAHGGEVSGDGLFSGMLTLFAAASLAGQATAEICSESVIESMVSVIIALYAVAVVVMRSVRIDKAWGTFAYPAGEITSGVSGSTEVESKEDASTKPKPDSAVSDPEVLRQVESEDGMLTRQEACEAIAKKYGLTSREQDILALLARGHNGVYISEALFISPNTVRTHIHNIYRKLGVSSREEILSMTNPEYHAEK